MLKRRLIVLLGALSVAVAGLPGLTSLAQEPPARPAPRGGQAAGHRGTGVLPHFTAQGSNMIRLLAGAFDPLADRHPTVRGMALVDEAALRAGVPQYWLAQVRDFRFPEAARAVEATGGTVVGIVPDATYMVRATPAQRQRVASSPAIRWMGYYQPAWRVPGAAGGRQGLLDLKGTQAYRVHLFRDEPDLAGAFGAIRAIAGVKVIERSGPVVDVAATAKQIAAIAAVPAVEWVGMKPQGVLLNANARWVNDTGVRDVYAATAPGRLTGAGQTAAVADTGVNYKPDLNGRAHVGFRDCDAAGVCKEALYTQAPPGTAVTAMNNVVAHNTGHRKMVAYFDLGNTGPNPYDTSSHGSHTGGSVDGDQPPYGQYTGEDGLAPAAMHVHQNIGTAGGGLALPADDYDLWRQAYRPRNPVSVLESSTANGNPADYSTDYRPLEDARTHNNSYGLIVPVIDEGSANALDRFVWDHEDMVVVVSAGNSGPDPGSIGSPSVAKNELSSGASANGRQPMASIDSMASFSSHGPTADGRFGVDLATPGQVVVSVKGGSEFDYHTAQGTSMSAPVLTGLATLVRQYFWDGYAAAGGDGFAGGAPSEAARHNPSAALVKAALSNGAVRMRGWYTGDDGQQQVTNGQWPSAGQGFGRVSLDNSLYFSNDPLNNWYADVYRGDTANPNPNLRPFPLSAAPASRSFQIQVAPGQPFDVTLAYTDSPILAPAGSPALVNNLDLSVTGPDGLTYVGNNMNSRLDPSVAVAETLPGPVLPDARNLTERVRLADPAPGTYTVTVQAGPIAAGNQGFALTASGNISPPGQSFAAGPPLQADASGTPVIGNLSVQPISADTAKISFDTNEPTTATAMLTDDGNTVTFIDSYNLGSGPLPGAPAGDTGYYGLNDATVETSPDFGNRPVVGSRHEILLTGLNPGAIYAISVKARDLGGNEITQEVSHTPATGVYQANAADIGQLAEGQVPIDPAPAGWRTGTQMYAGESGGLGLLGAYMFRIPEGSVDPAAITGAAVEMVSSHNWVPFVEDDPVLTVDLLPESFEANWGTQDYTTIHASPAAARAYPETTHKIGAYQRYGFTLRCADLQALKDSLTSVANGERKAAFRYDFTNEEEVSDALFAMEFGFNRRSRGAELRPRLVLFTGDQNPTGEACDPNTPAPTISDVGIHDGAAANSVTVSWRTDVSSDSMVLFREQGTQEWIQVGTPERTRLVHHVQVFGLDRSKQYEFVVRSSACNGATSTDTNSGAGYHFFHPETPVAEFFFHGTPEDQANKSIGPPFPAGSLTWDGNAPTEAVPVVQSAQWGAVWNQDFVANQAGAFWLGSFPAGTYDDDLRIRWHWSSQSPSQVAFGQSLDVTIFADPNFASGASRVQPERIIGRARVGLDLDFTPNLNTSTVHISGTVQQKLLIQAFPVFGVSSEGIQVTYDSVDQNGGFSFFLEDPPDLPLTGPVPPPSAGATGLNPPETRTGPASAADLAAGTGYCDIPSGDGGTEGVDLAISESDISLSSKKVKGGDVVTITATVHNVGDEDATGVAVHFDDNGTQINGTQTIASIPAGGTGQAKVQWSTKHLNGDHTITVTVDPADAIAETNEDNNVASTTVHVKGNKVQNGDFEDNDVDDDGKPDGKPDNWEGSGDTGYHEDPDPDDDLDEGRTVSARSGGSWTSEPVAVTQGARYGFSVDVAGTGGTVLIEQLSATGDLLGTVSAALSVAEDGLFHTVTRPYTAGAGVAAVRIVLVGSPAGPVTFDDVRLWEEAAA